MDRSEKKNILNKRVLRELIFTAVFIWCMGFTSQSLFSGSGFAVISYPFLKKIYGTVCHQLDVKTFSFLGHKLFVCARCTGIYLGALFMSLLSLFLFPKLKLGLNLLYASVLPVIFDVLMSSFHIYTYSKYVAFLTGLFFGSVVFIYILETVENNFGTNGIKDNE